MALKVGELEADVTLDDSKFDKGIDGSKSKFHRFAQDLAKGAEAGGSKAGGGLAKGVGDGLGSLKALPALAAGSAIGAAVISGFMQAMDIEDANHLLAAQLGFTEKQSAKSGKVAGDLYKQAFGDSVSDVDEVLQNVFQNGLAKIGDSEAAIEGVTKQVMNFSKISKEDALPVTRAVAQMLKTGLAKNATEAFDILTRGQQLGINKSEDLLDTFNEYGTQFRSIGLNGPLALGLMNQALQAGAKDSDLAADALKEFSIRAVDGSKTTVDGFKSLKLNAKDMQEQIAKGGPSAAAGLGLVLDALRNVKDPAEQARIAVELFGTQSEDMKKALLGMDTKTAVAGLGTLAGAAKSAGDTLNDTTSSGLSSVGRTIKLAIVDAIGKYALPKLKEFAGWFNGPGKFVLVSWALDAGSALIDFADKTLGAIESMIGGLSKYAKVALIAAAASVAIISPGAALDMLKQADSIGKWADEAKTGIHGARTELQSWKGALDKTNLKVKLQANIADLDAKLAKAQKELKDPEITKTREAELTADIQKLTEAKNKALGILGTPALVATKIAQLKADKTDLDAKIKAAKLALGDKGLTATKKAQLQANISQLLAAKRQAQAAINALTGKTVWVQVRAKVDAQLARTGYVEGRAVGGPVSKGTPYVVGEHNPELFVPDENGVIVPRVPGPTHVAAYGANFGPATAVAPVNVVLEVRSGGSAMDQLLLEVIRRSVRVQGGNVQTVLGTR